MSTRTAPPPERAQYLFVLWGDRFDEDVATIFTTEARRTGLCVKLVGLTGAQAVGGNGILISTDLTLSQAMGLADKAICVVIPCSPAALQRLEDDPRLVEFLQQAHANQALFVVSRQEAVERSSLKRVIPPSSSPSPQLSIYGDYQNLIGAVRQLVTTLAATVAIS